MTQRVVKLPDVGEGVAEAEVVEWNVAPGDTVVEDQVLGAVMTDKATVEIPSPVDGRVVSLGAELGHVLAVGADFVVLEQGADSGSIKADIPVEIDKPAAAPAPPATAPPAAPPPAVTASQRTSDGPAADSPVATESPQPAAAHRPPSAAVSSDGPVAQRALASPAVRHRARALGIDLASVEGSGVDGQVVHADLDFNLTGRSATAQIDDVTAVPLVGLRRQIAAQMLKSTQSIPHFTYVEEVDVTELERLRHHLKMTATDGQRSPTVLPFIVRAMVVAIADHPQMNARFDDAEGLINQYRAVHVGIATQTPSGLMVPVLHDAGRCSIDQISAGVQRLAEAARSGKASRDQLSGSTITLSSLGSLGGIVSTPVINQPEVAIIGVNKIVGRPVFVSGQVQQRKMMNLSSSFDHRAIDGHDAARFIQRIKSLLEHPATLFM